MISTARGIPYIEVLQLGFRRGLLHKLQNSAQVTDVDAPLVQSFCQGGTVHGQGTVVQAVLHLKYNILQG